MSKQNWYIVIGLAVVVLVVVMMSNSSSTKSNVNTTNLGTWGGIVAGTGNLFTGIGNAWSSIRGKSSAEDNAYTPNITYGDDITIGGAN